MMLIQPTAHADSDAATIVVRSAMDEKFFDGMWVEITAGMNLVHSGFTPLSYNATFGTTYTVFVSDFEDIKFQNWDDGATDYFKSVTPTSDVTLIAHYQDKSTDADKPASQPVPTTQPPNVPPQTPPVPTQANSTEPSLLPLWLRDVASLWLGGQMSDKDFISSLQRLVEQKILVPPPEKAPQAKAPLKPEGFSNLQCNKGERYVEMVGKYTNGDESYEIVSLRMVVLDSAGEILASGSGTISHIKAHETKYFNVITRYHEEFASCDVQVESVLPKLSSKN